MITLAIDPGPLKSGYVLIRNNNIIAFGKESLAEIKKIYLDNRPDRILIEITDWPVPLAGESYRDTNIVIGRMLEFFRCICLTIGRAEARNHFHLKNDSDVIKFLRQQNIKLKTDAWQAYLLYHYYETYGA